MTEQNFDMPPKFAFDEFYEMLKEYVTDQKAREALFTYDQEDMADRGNLLDSSMCSDLAYESYRTFAGAGWRILSQNGWPKHYQIIESTKGDMKKRRKYQSLAGDFIRIARRVIRKEPIERPSWEFQDWDIDIMDKENIKEFLKARAGKYPQFSPYEIGDD
ncbi:MAG: hypothetical protein ABJL57_13330 [Hyphomonas sp.]|uniref:hypothetical protein n=1 Tax=Hyphomonas sp. TaxID=87 RepID=UPI0032975187